MVSDPAHKERPVEALELFAFKANARKNKLKSKRHETQSHASKRVLCVLWIAESGRVEIGGVTMPVATSRGLIERHFGGHSSLGVGLATKTCGRARTLDVYLSM